MLVVKVSGVKEYRDRHGKLRRYHRASGTPIDPTLMGQELAAEVARLDKLHAPAEAKEGTLGGLLASYRASPRFTNRKPRTRADYQKIMDYLKPLADTPLVLVTPGFVAKLRDKALKAKRAGFTNHMLAMLSAAFKHGLEYEKIGSNPAAGVANAEMTADRRRPNRAWTADERRNVMAAAWPQLRLPLALAMFLGVRRGDIVAMPLQAYKDGWLTFRAGKNDALLRLPVLGQLRREIERALAERPKEATDLLLCLNTRGKRWTANGLSVQIDKFLTECRERGIMGPGGSLHGLRHSIGAELRGAGYDAEMRKLILGHDTDDMAEHYSASADVTGQLIDMANVLQARPKSNRRKR
jgi:integrase